MPVEERTQLPTERVDFAPIASRDDSPVADQAIRLARPFEDDHAGPGEYRRQGLAVKPTG
jgi:hypothetical protein